MRTIFGRNGASLLWVEWILGRSWGEIGGENENTAEFIKTPLRVDDYIKS